MGEAGRAIAWSALKRGTPVFAADGPEVGRVAEVVADEGKDIFSGIAFRPRLLGSARFAPADAIDTITDGGVRLRLSQDEASALGEYRAGRL